MMLRVDWKDLDCSAAFPIVHVRGALSKWKCQVVTSYTSVMSVCTAAEGTFSFLRADTILVDSNVKAIWAYVHIHLHAMPMYVLV